MNEINNGEESEVKSKGVTIFLTLLGWVCALVSLWAFPFVFGIVGVIMGILATKNGSRSGVALIVSSIVLMGIGMIFSGVIMNYSRHLLGI